MKLHIKQQTFTLTGRFEVFNDQGSPVYNVEGEFLNLSSKLHVFALDNTEAAVIKEKIITIIPKFQILIGGKVAAEVLKIKKDEGEEYFVGGPEWRIEGDPLTHEFTVLDLEGAIVMTHEKKWNSWGESFEMNVTREENSLLCVCISLVFENVLSVWERSAVTVLP